MQLLEVSGATFIVWGLYDLSSKPTDTVLPSKIHSPPFTTYSFLLMRRLKTENQKYKYMTWLVLLNHFKYRIFEALLISILNTDSKSVSSKRSFKSSLIWSCFRFFRSSLDICMNYGARNFTLVSPFQRHYPTPPHNPFTCSYRIFPFAPTSISFQFFLRLFFSISIKLLIHEVIHLFFYTQVINNAGDHFIQPSLFGLYVCIKSAHAVIQKKSKYNRRGLPGEGTYLHKFMEQKMQT